MKENMAKSKNHKAMEKLYKIAVDILKKGEWYGRFN
jgi:hypothetical protein